MKIILELFLIASLWFPGQPIEITLPITTSMERNCLSRKYPVY
jgi:hypothetical protein